MNANNQKIIENSDEFRKIKKAEIQDLKPEYSFKGLYDIKYLIRSDSVLDNIVVKEGIYDKWLCTKLGRKDVSTCF